MKDLEKYLVQFDQEARVARAYLVPKVDTDTYVGQRPSLIGDPWGRYSLLAEKGFRSSDSLKTEWIKKLVGGDSSSVVILDFYPEQEGLGYKRVEGLEGEAGDTLVHWKGNIIDCPPDVTPEKAEKMFREMIGDLFYLAR